VAFLGEETKLEELLDELLDPVTGYLKEEGEAIAKPIADEVSKAVEKVVREELDKQIPKFALISGSIFGATLLFGIALGLLTTKQRWKLR